MDIKLIRDKFAEHFATEGELYTSPELTSSVNILITTADLYSREPSTKQWWPRLSPTAQTRYAPTR